MTKGRKRKPGPRSKNGRLSNRAVDRQAMRSIDEQQAMQVAKEARQRLFGLSVEQSATERAGTVCGRLALQGSITTRQLEAAKAFARTYADYQWAMNSPRPPKAVEIGAATGRGGGLDISPEQHRKAIAAWDSVRRSLVEANSEYRGANLIAACDYLVLRDEMHGHMIGDLRLALNALVRHYGLMAVAA